MSGVNQGKATNRYTALRIDEVPDANSDDDDDGTFVGFTRYTNKVKSPATIEQHLVADDANMVHFKAMAKYYGVGMAIA